MGGLSLKQSCLKVALARETSIYSPMNYHRNPNPARSDRRKRSPASRLDKKNSSCSKHTVVAKFPVKDLVMGQVKILKRGEELKDFSAAEIRASEVGETKTKVEDLDDFELSSTDRLAPEPEKVPKQVRPTDFYAGSAIFSSPPPSSLPFPAFFTKGSVLAKTEDAATVLRQNLRLDMQ